MKLFATKKDYEIVPDALLVWTSFGFGVRLWARQESRYELAMDQHRNALWRRWLVVHWWPTRVFVYYTTV